MGSVESKPLPPPQDRGEDRRKLRGNAVNMPQNGTTPLNGNAHNEGPKIAYKTEPAIPRRKISSQPENNDRHTSVYENNTVIPHSRHNGDEDDLSPKQNMSILDKIEEKVDTGLSDEVAKESNKAFSVSDDIRWDMPNGKDFTKETCTECTKNDNQFKTLTDIRNTINIRQEGTSGVVDSALLTSSSSSPTTQGHDINTDNLSNQTVPDNSEAEENLTKTLPGQNGILNLVHHTTAVKHVTFSVGESKFAQTGVECNYFDLLGPSSCATKTVILIAVLASMLNVRYISYHKRLVGIGELQSYSGHEGLGYLFVALSLSTCLLMMYVKSSLLRRAALLLKADKDSSHFWNWVKFLLGSSISLLMVLIDGCLLFLLFHADQSIPELI